MNGLELTFVLSSSVKSLGRALCR